MILRRVVERFSRPDGDVPDASVPDGERVYAVGDVHGRADLLYLMRERIAEDVAARPPDGPATTVFLGDYVDRGADSRGVLDMLAGEAFPTRTVFLVGNHEAMMLDFLQGAELAGSWLPNGGIETLRSYGVAVDGLRAEAGLDELARRLREVLPAAHRRFLHGLQLTHEVGDYFFCHAGVRPGVPLDRQLGEDLLWIRQEFLASEHPFGKIVIHGHTPVREPEVRANRINVDTGAFASGRLTCVVLEGSLRRFLFAEVGGGPPDVA